MGFLTTTKIGVLLFMIAGITIAIDRINAGRGASPTEATGTFVGVVLMIIGVIFIVLGFVYRT